MNITKLGHCCLLIEVGSLRILTDPGNFSTAQRELRDIHVVLITHEHGDHLHIDSLKHVLANNKRAEVFTNAGVGKLLDAERIPYQLLEGTGKMHVRGISLEALDGAHEEIFEEVGQVQNTGYFIADTLFYSGDSFKQPERPVEVLALPVAGPWCTIADAIRYCQSVAPKKAFPVHDGMIRPEMIGVFHRIPGQVLATHDIEFTPLLEGGSLAL